MTSEDPFFMVKNEVSTELEKSNRLFQQWKELRSETSAVSRDEFHSVTIELRNVLRLIDWDLEDLEEAMLILERNPKKFKVDETEIVKRQQFISSTRAEVNNLKDEFGGFQDGDGKSRSMTNFNSTNLSSFTNGISGLSGAPKYTRLQNELESPSRRVYNQTTEPVFDDFASGPTSLMIKKAHQNCANNETTAGNDEHSIMLDDFCVHSALNDPKLDTPFKKLMRALQLAREQRHLTAITLGSCLFFAVVFFFFI